MRNLISKIKVKESYKYENDLAARLSSLIFTLALFNVIMRRWFLWLLMLVVCLWGFVDIYRLYKKTRVELFDILGLIFPVIYAICVIVTPFFDMIMVFYWMILFVAMLFSVKYCKEEDGKGIALLHVMYMASCTLVMPCIGPSI